jgi:hypothetical protein
METVAAGSEVAAMEVVMAVAGWVATEVAETEVATGEAARGGLEVAAMVAVMAVAGWVGTVVAETEELVTGQAARVVDFHKQTPKTRMASRCSE